MHLMDYVFNMHNLFWHYHCWRLGEYLIRHLENRHDVIFLLWAVRFG